MTLTDTQLDKTDTNHDLFAHIVIPAHKVTEAYITGSAVVALCGKEWVPTRDPDALPVCQTCRGLWDALP